MHWYYIASAIWILGIITFYILDGWIHYDLYYDRDEWPHRKGEPIIGVWIAVAITWPIWFPFYALIKPIIMAHDKLSLVKENHIRIKEQERQLRIVQEKETQKQISEVEEELNLFDQKLANKKRARQS